MLTTTFFLWMVVPMASGLSLEKSSSIPHGKIVPKRITLQLPSSAKKVEPSARLTLRGGGFPVIPIVAVAAAAIALKLNEGLREFVMGALSHVSMGDRRRRPLKRATKKPNVVKKEEKVVRTPLKPGYDLRNGWVFSCEKNRKTTDR
jgi:hypothetical protein